MPECGRNSKRDRGREDGESEVKRKRQRERKVGQKGGRKTRHDGAFMLGNGDGRSSRGRGREEDEVTLG